MSPKAHTCFWIIGRKPRVPRPSSYFLAKGIYFIICERTVRTILDSIKLPLSVKSKSKFIVHPFSVWNILSPRKLNFISVPIYFWRGNNRVKSREFVSIEIFEYRVKGFTNLSFFYLELIFISDSKPFCSAIHLMSWFKIFFYWWFFYNGKYLSFQMRLLWFKNS